MSKQEKFLKANYKYLRARFFLHHKRWLRARYAHVRKRARNLWKPATASVNNFLILLLVTDKASI